MSVHGFVLVCSRWGDALEVYRNLLLMDEVVAVHPMFGEPDMLVMLQGPELGHLGQVLARKIRRLPGVVETRTFGGTPPRFDTGRTLDGPFYDMCVIPPKAVQGKSGRVVTVGRDVAATQEKLGLRPRLQP